MEMRLACELKKAENARPARLRTKPPLPLTTSHAQTVGRGIIERHCGYAISQNS